jgi:hypothetical protein
MNPVPRGRITGSDGFSGMADRPIETRAEGLKTAMKVTNRRTGVVFFEQDFFKRDPY